MTNFIYRIEDKNGKGPYTPTNIDILKNHYIDSIHPTPEDERKNLREYWYNLPDYEKEKYIFGFNNIKQYLMWFSQEERKELFKQGYRLKKVKVKNKISGYYQSIGIRIK